MSITNARIARLGITSNQINLNEETRVEEGSASVAKTLLPGGSLGRLNAEREW